MKLYSTLSKTLNKNNTVDLKTAVLTGMPQDGGLYMPSEFPVISKDDLNKIQKMSFQEMSYFIATKFFANDLPADVLKDIVYQAMSFDAPLVSLYDNVKILELFHGPTFAFKDFAARFMARIMSYFVKQDGKKLKIIVATSGDTGSAVANSFYNVENIDVVILYPSGKISKIQEQQIATMDKNIKSLEIDGTFDDCQRLVKTALADEDLKKKLNFSSANSINIARLLPQTFYYFRAWTQLSDKEKANVVCCVPSGNFGNLCAGLVAKKIGLPIKKFIAATNMNDVVPQYLQTGTYKSRPSVSTISNAMDVGNPSNFARITDLYANVFENIKSDVVGFSFTDEETRKNIRDIYKKYSYILDPHGSVGLLGLNKYMSTHKDVSAGIFLETAHPAKFIDVVEQEIGTSVTIPPKLMEYMDRKKTSIKMANDYKKFRAFIEKN